LFTDVKLLYLASPSSGRFTDPPTVAVALRVGRKTAAATTPAMAAPATSQVAGSPRGGHGRVAAEASSCVASCDVRTSACTWERRPSHSLMGYMILCNRVMLTRFSDVSVMLVTLQ